MKIASLTDLSRHDHDTIIDVRSPAEFAEDHIPGAINLPALSDAERAEVGTIYVQDSPFRARKIGAALVARNVASHLEGPLRDQPGGWRPLVHCWRGGQRSQSFASILSQIGWRADVLDGGYKAYRRLVKQQLYDRTFTGSLVLVDGGTGTAKTRLLHHITQQGGQCIDIEALAAHRGSLFGQLNTDQPSQKAFESALASIIVGLDPNRTTFVEAESSKIGQIIVPPALWHAMIKAPRIRIDAPIPARAAYLVRAYSDLLEDPEKLDQTLSALIRYHGHELVDVWRDLHRDGAYEALAQELVAAHYDPRYQRSASRQKALMRNVTLANLDDQSLADLAASLIRDPGFNGS